MFLALFALGTALKGTAVEKRPKVLEDAEEDRTPAEMFGIVMGIFIWAGTLLFAIIYYILKCECYSCCLRGKVGEDTQALKAETPGP
jgi:hypothetical protein